MSRESTNALWTRVLRQLIDMTRGGKIAWDDTGVHGTYAAPTGSGVITIATHLGGLGDLEMPVSQGVSRLVGLPTQVALSMDDAQGKTVSSLQVEEPDQSPLGRATARIQSDNADTELLYKLAIELAELIEATPARASSIADSILDDLAE